MTKISIIFSVVILSLANLFTPQDVSAQDPSIDFSSVDDIVQESIDEGITPGATVLVKKGDHMLYHESFGHSYLYDMGTRLENPIAATNETIYDLASVTKVMATTQAVMKLVHEGQLDIDAPVTQYLEGFGNNAKENITSRQLLTHTSGLPQWEPTFLHVNTREGEREYVNNLELMFEPGTYRYSDFSFMTLAFVVEEITDQPIEVYLEENIYGPLGMEDTMFTPLESGVNPNRIAATSWGNQYEWRMSNQRDWDVGYDTTEHQEAFDNFDGWRERTLVGEVNDGNAGMANEGVAGHAGLFSTAHDLSILGDVLLRGGERNGVQIYNQETIDSFTTEQSGISNRGLGWRVGGSNPGTGFVGDYANANTFAHDGFTGTQVVFHGDYDLQVIVLSNKQNNGPYDDYGSYYSTYALSRNINNAVFEEILPDISNVDKTDLQELVEESDQYNEDDYTASSWANLTTVLEESRLMIEKENVLQLEVDAVHEELVHAIDNLEFLVNKEELENIINEANSIDRDLFTISSTELLQENVEEAIEALNSELVTQKKIDNHVIAIQNSIDNLVRLGDKTELENLVEEAKSIDLREMTESTADRFKKKLEEATQILADEQATQDEIDSVVVDLRTAIDALEKEIIDDKKEDETKEDETEEKESSLIPPVSDNGDDTDIKKPVKEKELPATGEQTNQSLLIGISLITTGLLIGGIYLFSKGKKVENDSK